MLLLCAVPPASAAVGGPDAGGYVWLDSSVYSWTSISASGTNLALGDEDEASIFPSGFSFDHYAATFTAACATDNGLITFPCGNAPNAMPIPNAAAPNGFLAAYWTDFDPECVNNGAANNVFTQVSGTAPRRTLTVQWNDLALYKDGLCGTPRSTFQAKLYEATNIMEVHIKEGFNVDSSTAFGATGLVVHPVTSGTENDAGAVGLQYGHQSTTGWSVTNRGIRYFINDADDAMPQTVTVATGSTATFSLSLSDDPKTISLTSGLSAGTGTLTGFPASGIHYWQPGSLTYTPPANWCGTTSFTYATDDGFNTDSATVTLDVTGCNDPPTANDDSYSLPEDGSITAAQGSVLVNDLDPDTQPAPLTAVLDSGPTNAQSFTLDAAGTFTYVPLQDWHGTDTFTYHAHDGQDDSNQATVTISVTPVNDAPVASPVSVSTDEDTAATGLLAATDVEGDAVSFTIVAPASLGTVSLDDSLTGAFTYTPNAGVHGTDAFTFKANDGAADSNIATVTVTIASVEDAPTATGFSFTTNEDTAYTGTLTGSDEDGDALTYSITTQGLLGSVTVDDAASGAFTYTPIADVHGSDSFTFQVSDGDQVASATVTITISSVPDAPVADDLSLTTDEDMPVSGAATASDADGDVITFSITSQGTIGTASIDSTTGAVTYTPLADAVGTDTLTYRASDGALYSDATITVVIAAVNDAPTFAPGGDVTRSADGIQKTLQWATGITPGGGPDEASQSVQFHMTVDDASIFDVSPALAPDGTLTFTPGSAPGATDIHVYLEDSLGAMSGAHTFRITVANINAAPTFTLTTPPAVQAGSGPQVVDNVLTDLTAGPGWESNQLIISITLEASQPGLFTEQPAIDSNGRLTYTPGPSAGTTTVLVTVKDDGGTAGGGQDTATGTFTMTLTAANELPVAVDDHLETWSNAGPLAVDVLGNDHDAEGAVHVLFPAPGFPAAYQALHGTLSVHSGTLYYEADPDFTGTDAFVYVIEDQNGATAVATATVTVTPDPWAVDDGAGSPINVAAGQATVIDVRANDVGRLRAGLGAGNPDHIIAVTQATQGAVSHDGSTVTYQPALHAAGIDTFTYTLSGGSTAQVTVDIAPVTTAAHAGIVKRTIEWHATGRAVTFVDPSAQGTVAWQWEFGDSGTSSASNPTHTYAADGTYNVTLTTHAADGTSITYRAKVNVPGPVPPALTEDTQTSSPPSPIESPLNPPAEELEPDVAEPDDLVEDVPPAITNEPPHEVTVQQERDRTATPAQSGTTDASVAIAPAPVLALMAGFIVAIAACIMRVVMVLKRA